MLYTATKHKEVTTYSINIFIENDTRMKYKSMFYFLIERIKSGY